MRAIAARWGWTLKEEKRFLGYFARGEFEGKSLFLLVPTTYMNESGRAVRALVDFYKLPLDTLMIVCDDIALKLGTLRLRPEGSAGGHNGLKSVEQHLGTTKYKRLRMGIGQSELSMGIGQSEPAMGLADYVLGPFTSDEIEALPQILKRACEALEMWIKEPLERVMERINTREKITGEQKDESNKTKAEPL